MITFNEETHEYKVNGVIKRSVTQVLKDVGIIDCDFVKPYYIDRGDRVHKYCTLLMQGWIKWYDIVSDCIEFVGNFARVVDRLGLEYMSAEVPCYSEELDICGTYDLVMERDGEKVLVELKTGIFPMWGGLQLAAYEKMVEVDTVMGISLKDGKVFVKADDFLFNHLTWDDIKHGTFDLEKWKSNKKRRHMRVLK